LASLKKFSALGLGGCGNWPERRQGPWKCRCQAPPLQVQAHHHLPELAMAETEFHDQDRIKLLTALKEALEAVNSNVPAKIRAQLTQVSGARCGLRHDRIGRCRKVKSKGEKGRKGVVGKAAGDECVFIPGEVLGWQMRSGSTLCRTGPLNRKG
jgi:hypothetical protein